MILLEEDSRLPAVRGRCVSEPARLRDGRESSGKGGDTGTGGVGNLSIRFANSKPVGLRGLSGLGGGRKPFVLEGAAVMTLRVAVSLREYECLGEPGTTG